MGSINATCTFIHLSIYLFIYPSIHSYIYLLIFPPMYSYIYLLIFPPMYSYIYLLIFPPMYSYIYLFIYPFIYLSFIQSFLYFSIYLSIHYICSCLHLVNLFFFRCELFTSNLLKVLDVADKDRGYTTGTTTA